MKNLSHILAQAQLYVLLDAQFAEGGLDDLVLALVDAGVDVIQLREKKMSDADLLKTARRIVALTAQTQTLFIMNDRPDLAVACGADGVHLGQEDGSVAAAFQVFAEATEGSEKLVGVSTHSIDQARAALLAGASYIGVGPVFESRTKSFAAHVGLKLVEEVAREINIPAFAIGGIGLQNVDKIVRSGLVRVAVSAAVVQASEPADVARMFKEKLSGRRLQ